MTVMLFGVAIMIDKSPTDPQTLLGTAVVIGVFTLGALEAALFRIVIAENGIEKRDMLGRIRRWSYRDIHDFEMRVDHVRIHTVGGYRLKVWAKMASPSLVVVLLKRCCPPVIGDERFARWTVAQDPGSSG